MLICPKRYTVMPHSLNHTQMDWKTVVLEGIQDFTSSRIQVYFKRHFGPVEVLPIEKGCGTAVLKFERPQDAANCVKTNIHVLGKDKVHLVASWFCNQVILDNTDGISENRLKLYFSNKKRGGTVLDIITTDKREVVIIFQRHEDAKKAVNNGTLNISGTLVQARLKPHEKVYVQVHGWPENASLSRMRMYFGNKARGGRIEELTEMEGHIIRFKDESDALKVVNTGKFEFSGTEVTTSWYKVDHFKTTSIDNPGGTRDSDEHDMSLLESGAVGASEGVSQQPSNISPLGSDNQVSSEPQSNVSSKHTPLPTPKQSTQHCPDYSPPTQSSAPPPPPPPTPPPPPPITAPRPSSRAKKETTGNISPGGNKGKSPDNGKANIGDALSDIAAGRFKLRTPAERKMPGKKDQSDVSGNMKKSLHEQLERFRKKVASSSEEVDEPLDD